MSRYCERVMMSEFTRATTSSTSCCSCPNTGAIEVASTTAAVATARAAAAAFFMGKNSFAKLLLCKAPLVLERESIAVDRHGGLAEQPFHVRRDEISVLGRQ